MLRFEERVALYETPGIAGIDEVGRGPLAGPVVAAAVVLPYGFDCRGLGDSKQLTADQRRRQYKRIAAEAEWAIGVVSAHDIDALNILEATMQAMRHAVEALSTAPKEALVDGNRVPTGLPCAATPVVKGDSLYACIAAASIVAKVTRDELMAQMAAQYPRYGFDKHFGYPTPEHMRALKLYGPCPIHRRSFGPVRSMLDQPCLLADA